MRKISTCWINITFHLFYYPCSFSQYCWSCQKVNVCIWLMDNRIIQESFFNDQFLHWINTRLDGLSNIHLIVLDLRTYWMLFLYQVNQLHLIFSYLQVRSLLLSVELHIGGLYLLQFGLKIQEHLLSSPHPLLRNESKLSVLFLFQYSFWSG